MSFLLASLDQRLRISVIFGNGVYLILYLPVWHMFNSVFALHTHNYCFLVSDGDTSAHDTADGDKCFRWRYVSL